MELKTTTKINSVNFIPQRLTIIQSTHRQQWYLYVESSRLLVTASPERFEYTALLWALTWDNKAAL